MNLLAYVERLAPEADSTGRLRRRATARPTVESRVVLKRALPSS
jgi:hypothetical protein